MFLKRIRKILNGQRFSTPDSFTADESSVENC